MTGTSGNREPLRRTTLLSYGLAEMPISMAAMPVSLFIPAFYTQDLGLSLTAVGLILMLARVGDVITDPLIGVLSDRTTGRLGRRRPWILASTPMIMLSVYYLFMPAGEVSKTYLFGWIMLLWLGWTLFNIPYFAWGAELSPDYQERTRVTGWRTILGLCGTVTAVICPVVGETFFGYGGASNEALRMIGLLSLVLLPASMVLLIWRVPDRQDFVPALMPMRTALKVMWDNGPFKRLVLAFLLQGLAVSLTTPLFVLFVIHVIGASTGGPLVILVHYVASMIGLPFWVWLASRIGKHRAWLCSIVLLGAMFPMFLTIGEGDLLKFNTILFFVGFAVGNFGAIPTSMKADVIDLDALESGQDRAGIFFATWSLTSKLVAAMGVGISMPVLALLGFDPRGATTPEQVDTLRTYFALAPVIFYLAAAATVWGYPITAEVHASLRARLEERNAARDKSAGVAGS